MSKFDDLRRKAQESRGSKSKSTAKVDDVQPDVNSDPEDQSEPAAKKANKGKK